MGETMGFALSRTIVYWGFDCAEDSIPFTRSIKTVPLAPVGYPLVNTETADLLRKHGGKTGEELKAEGK
jgi:hypothetical protein